MFQMVLKTPQMSEFIELCIVHGADLYQVCLVEELVNHTIKFSFFAKF